jgi:hypothetical protein
LSGTAQTASIWATNFANAASAKKHLRWSQHGKQFRRATGARSWAGAEDKKLELEAQLSGRVPENQSGERLLATAIEAFEANKEAQGI